MKRQAFEQVERKLQPVGFLRVDVEADIIALRERGELLRGVFEDAFNYMKNGTLLRQVINKLNEIDFNYFNLFVSSNAAVCVECECSKPY